MEIDFIPFITIRIACFQAFKRLGYAGITMKYPGKANTAQQ